MNQLLDGLFSNLLLIMILCIIDMLENRHKIIALMQNMGSMWVGSLTKLPPIPIEIFVSIEIACFLWKIYIIRCIDLHMDEVILKKVKEVKNE